MMTRYHSTRARRLGREVVDAALPKAVGPLGKPGLEQLANLDVEAELEAGQEDER